MKQRVQGEFPHHPNLVTAALADLTREVFPGEARESVAIERIQLAALLLAEGDLRKLDDAVALGRRDWRDLLVAAGLAGEDWQERVTAELRPPPAPHS